MDKKLIEKYLFNQCTSEELDEVLLVLGDPDSPKEFREELFNIYNHMNEDDSPDEKSLEVLLGRIHIALNLNLSDKPADYLVKSERRGKIINFLLRAAAVLLLPLMLYSLLITFKYESSRKDQVIASQSYNEVVSSEDAITRVILPDGTGVWLNHSSSIRYPNFFNGKFRTIELKGEGYFEVAHNTSMPFIVKAGEIEIQATGTSFNVLAWPDEDRIETFLISGAVELKRLEKDGSEISLLKMKPKDLAIYETSKRELNRISINDDRYYSWKDRKLVFIEEPLGEVVKKLRRWYNVDIVIRDPDINEITLTATFVHESLTQVMELLALITPVNYSISARQDLGNGTFTKRIVTLSRKKK